MTAKRVLCIFCDMRRQRSREDIISGWLADELGGQPPFFAGDDLTIRDGRVTHRGKVQKHGTGQHGTASVIKLPRVCVSCNGTWMSRLEERAKRVLLPMIRGQATTLSPEDQRVISAWGQLKLITYDARCHGGPALSAHIAHRFYDTAQPLGHPLVLLGAFSGYEAGIGIPHARWVGNAVSMKGDRPPHPVVRVTFAFGNLFIQVLDLVELHDWSLELLAPSDASYLIRCWPQEPGTALSWPPPTALGPNNWLLLA